MQTCLLFYSSLCAPPLTFGFGCGFLWPIMKSKNISVWQTFTWKFLTLKNDCYHRQLLSDNTGVEMRPENYPVGPHLDTPFPFPSSHPTKPQAPSATAQSQFSQRLWHSIALVKRTNLLLKMPIFCLLFLRCLRQIHSNK